MSQKRGGRTKALLAGCLLALVLGEILLRILALVPWSTGLFVADPDTGFRQRPGATISGLPTNSRGFNGPEPAAVKTGRRLGVVGDSFVFAAVPRGLDFVSRLGAGIRKEPPAGPPVEVVNLGILAAGPENYLGVLEKDGVELDLDGAIVVFFVGNDISQADPHFKTRIFLGSPRAILRSPFELRLSSDYFYSFKMLRGGRRLLGELIHPPEPGGTFSREVFFELEKERLEICRRRPSPKIEREYQGTAAFFDQLKDFERRHGMRIAVVLAPDQLQVDPVLQADLLPAGWEQEFDLDLPQRRLGAELERRGIPHLDLLPRLRRRAAERVLYLERDTHWNADGNRLVATFLLEDGLRSWGWLDAQGVPLDSPGKGD